MAQLTVFGYRYRPTAVHAVDVRMKLAVMAAMSLAVLHAGPFGLTLAGIAALALLVQVRLPVRQALSELRWFLSLLVFVWGIRAITTPGDPLAAWYGIELTRQGAYTGAIICWRWLLIVCFGMCLTASTKSADISAAMEWGLRPLIGRSAHKVGLMIGLLIRSIALILHQAKELSDAQRSRAIENRKNPLYRMRMTALPLVRRSFLSADRMALAIAARCYSEDRTPRQWNFKGVDWIALLLAICVCGAMVMV